MQKEIVHLGFGVQFSMFYFYVKRHKSKRMHIINENVGAFCRQISDSIVWTALVPATVRAQWYLSWQMWQGSMSAVVIVDKERGCQNWCNLSDSKWVWLTNSRWAIWQHLIDLVTKQVRHVIHLVMKFKEVVSVKVPTCLQKFLCCNVISNVYSILHRLFGASRRRKWAFWYFKIKCLRCITDDCCMELITKGMWTSVLKQVRVLNALWPPFWQTGVVMLSGSRDKNNPESHFPCLFQPNYQRNTIHIMSVYLNLIFQMSMGSKTLRFWRNFSSINKPCQCYSHKRVAKIAWIFLSW